MAARAIGYILVTYRAYPEGDQWVSECPELGTASCGDTMDEALNNIRDASTLYLNTIERQGERQRVFRERRIALYLAKPGWNAPVLRRREEEVIRPHIERVPALA